MAQAQPVSRVLYTEASSLTSYSTKRVSAAVFIFYLAYLAYRASERF